ncbi:MAG: hypothetical protein GX222_08960 [Ruminococcaceae bacterium]|nr:hypothetical protein [Oscillospiraceae bacterium]
MLTFRQLDDIPKNLTDLLSLAEQSIINDMARRIAKLDNTVTSATNWQMIRLQEIGTAQEYIITELSRALNMTEQEIVNIFDEAATRTIKSDDAIYKAAGYSPVPLAENPFLQQIIASGVERTKGEFYNLTQTTAYTSTRQFERALDLAHVQITTGVMDYQMAVKQAIRSLALNGIEAITYPSGWVDYLDVATRRAILTGVNQTCGQLQEARADEMGCDLMELTAHHGARPEHAIWQGRIVSRSGQPGYLSLQDIGYGLVTGFKGANCRHDWFPFFEGLSHPAYSNEKLREYNNRTVKYNGEEISLYDATQKQRYIERQIRRWKREKGAYEAAGLDSSFASGKVREWQARQRDFISQTGLRRDYFRERAEKQNLEAASKDDIIIRQLRAIGVKGQIHCPKRTIDVSSLTFDDTHINVERLHGVTESEAKSYIENAAISITRWNGSYENYFGHQGVAYVNILENKIRTAFSSAEFDDKTKAIMEVLKKNGR